MKTNFKYIRAILAMLLLAISFTACNKDEDKDFGSVSSGDLNTLISEAQTILIENPTSTNPGDYTLEAISLINKALNKALEIQKYAYSQDQLEYGYNQLKNAINKADGMRVELAMPWIQQENDTWIQISDNIKPVLTSEFTIEIQCYIIDLNVKGHSNNLFSSEQSAPDAGFAVRYYSDGKIQIVVGNNNWIDTGDQAGAGTMKSGEWMNVAMANTGSHQILYVNGVKVAENDNTHLPAANVPFIVGNSPQWTDRVCNTLVRDLRVWNKVLDDATIAANTTETIDGTESGLECYFPLQANLGNEFIDVTGNYSATIQGNIEWVKEPPVIILDYTNIDNAIAEITQFRGTIVEGTQNGDYPIGTLAYIDELIATANNVRTNDSRQMALDDQATSLLGKIDLINSMLVGDADGVFVDRDNPVAIGFRITPNYTPSNDYTVEFEVKVKTLQGYGTGEFFNNGEFGVWVNGYEELTEEAVLASGGLWNFTSTPSDGWQGPKTDPLAIIPGNWQHVAIVHDNTARITTLYVDGVEKGQQTDIGAPNNSGWGEIWLGNGWGKMHGSIKNFRMWNETRTAGQLNVTITGSEPNLEIYFPLNKVAGVGFSDVTGNYNGEMRGISWNIN